MVVGLTCDGDGVLIFFFPDGSEFRERERQRGFGFKEIK